MVSLCLLLGFAPPSNAYGQPVDIVAGLQVQSVLDNRANWAHWGPNPETYSGWRNHSNRLIPVYSFGGNLHSVKGAKSLYRNVNAIQKRYGYLPTKTHNPAADYFDQTDIFRLQRSAIEAGKKRIILFVFDGLDWQMTQAANIAKHKKIAYTQGRGTGLSFQDYRGSETDFGYMVTSPHNTGTKIDVDKQRVSSVADVTRGGYDPKLGGTFPWDSPRDVDYPIGKSQISKHAYTDSAASATSMTSGIKTYNGAINVDPLGRPILPLARTLQEQGFATGIVTNVPISHATPACAYANNVHRNDYQDLTRDLIGRPSSFHPGGLEGVDILIGCGWGIDKESDGDQGKNFVAGNRYISEQDLKAIDVAQDGKYVVAQRTSGKKGSNVLANAVAQAKRKKKRLFGFFGATNGHLPYRTADGNYDPVIGCQDSGIKEAEKYTQADLHENPSLSQMSIGALDLLDSKSNRWWLMIESGDVDWASHSNNIDNSIGAVLSGDEAFAAVVAWIEKNGGWKETYLIVTADHGHYFNLDRPQALFDTGQSR